MSMLFDAFKRAQSKETEASSETSAGGHRRAYRIAGLALLICGVMLIMYLFASSKAPPARPLAAAKPASLPAPPQDLLPASAPLAAPGAAQLAAASSVQAPPKKAWTHPAAARKPQRRKPARKPVAMVDADQLKDAYLALSAGNLDLAQQKYLAAIALRPHEKDALLGLAIIAQRKMQLARAEQLYRQVLREDFGNAAAAAGLVSLSELADPVAAESQLRELIDIKPSAPELHYALGGVLARQQRWDEAQQAFYRAFGLAPDSALYAYDLAVSLDHLHQHDAALPYYEKAAAGTKEAGLNKDAILLRIRQLKRGR